MDVDVGVVEGGRGVEPEQGGSCKTDGCKGIGMLYKLSVIEVDRDGRLFGRWIRVDVCHVREADVGVCQ